MSLIMDALKRAQQLRPKESQGIPVLKHSSPENKRGLGGSGKRWALVTLGLVCLAILGILYWRSLSPTGPTEIAAPIQRAKVPAPEPMKKEYESPRDPRSEALLAKRNVQRESVPEKGKAEPPAKAAAKDVEPKKVMAKDPPVMPRKPPLPEPVSAKPAKKAAPKSLIETPPPQQVEVEDLREKDRVLAFETITHFNLGVHLQQQGETAKAIKAYQKAVELDPTYVEAYNNLGILYQEMGDLDNALNTLQRLIEANPRYVKGLNNLGLILHLKGRNEEAIATYQKALSINDHNIESHINLGILLKKQGHLERALECYRRALEIQPLHGETHYNLALLYEQLERLDSAIEHYQKFIQISSKAYPKLVLRVQRHLNHLLADKGGLRE